MVCTYGMSEKIGPVSFSDDGHDVFLGRDFAQQRSYSDSKAIEIDNEITKLLTDQYDAAMQILKDNRAALDRISEALLERETLESEDLKLLVEGKPLPPLPALAGTETDNDPPPERAPAEPSGKYSGDKLPDPEPVPG
jgi:cell division protease FtsH